MPTNIQFPQFLNRYNIRLFFSSVEDTIPGSLLTKEKKGYTPVGHLSDFITDPIIKWKTEQKEANIVYGTVERSLSLNGKASMNQFGVHVSGGLGRVKQVRFYIEEVQAMGFIKPMRLKLIDEVNQYRKKNRASWKKINGKCVVDYTYYASKVTFEFEREGDINLKTELSNKIDIGAEAGLKWKSKNSFVVSNNSKVPFGFTGWEI